MSSFPKSVSISKELHIFNEGYQVILEAVALTIGINFKSQKDIIRSSYLFQKFILHFCTQMDIINELFSAAPQSSSSAKRPEEVEVLLREHVKQANHNMKVVHSISVLLLKTNESEDDEMKRNLVAFVKLAQRTICGIILWQVHLYRYDNSSGLAFDCYVHNNKTKSSL